MTFITDKIIDVTGRLLRKIPNVRGKHFYSKLLLKPIINRLDIEQTLELNSGSSKIICRLRDWIPWNIYIHGKYIVEEAYEKFMLSYCADSKIIFDVGANIGYYTLQFAKETDGKVYAFEPVSHQYKTLIRNLEINELNNVCPVKKIVSDLSGKHRIYISEMNNTSASSIVNKTHKYEDVHAITLDKFCENNLIQSIDLLKIDVEGYELKVLKGLSNMLVRCRVNNIFIEIVEKHLNKAGTSSEELVRYLNKFNYNGYSIKTGKIEKYKVGSDESLVFFTHQRLK